jgi:hypothetical protein
MENVGEKTLDHQKKVLKVQGLSKLGLKKVWVVNGWVGSWRMVKRILNGVFDSSVCMEI